MSIRKFSYHPFVADFFNDDFSLTRKFSNHPSSADIYNDDFFSTPSTFFGPPAVFTRSDWMMPFRHRNNGNFNFRHSHPGYECSETDTNYQISIDVPGMKASDVNVELEENGRVLSLSGERKFSKGDVAEEAKFQKRIMLHKNVDKEEIKANLQHGVLTIIAPKVEVKATEPIKIPITEGLSKEEVTVKK